MNKLVIRDARGAVINIGPWDYMLRDGVPTNPPPEGATAAEEDVIEREDGGLAAASDYVSLRRGAYPSLVDQIDALWKGGAAADDMRDRVLGVKAKYPKAAG
jgi:hypothetical protein